MFTDRETDYGHSFSFLRKVSLCIAKYLATFGFARHSRRRIVGTWQGSFKHSPLESEMEACELHHRKSKRN